LRILITGGLGFIGSNFIRYTLKEYPNDEVINLDLVTYAGNPENLIDVEADYSGRYQFIKGDVCDGAQMEELVGQADLVAHFAAESHVDRSIEDAGAFVRTNVLGSQTLLAAAQRAWGDDASRRFLYVSTDEVYGALRLDDPRSFKEEWPLDPKSPYSASKAGGDLMAQAYHHTFGLPVVITRCSNNYGPFQFPEKLIPLMILNTLEGKELPVYGDGMYVRDWIQVLDNCRASDAVLRRGRAGEVYNIGGNSERHNIDVVKGIIRAVCDQAGLDYEERLGLIRHVKDRPGHDRRYAIDADKLEQELGITPLTGFEQGLADTVDWYLNNQKWCERVRSGQYLEYYQRMYEKR
jgi:dTDP-glucose 4,6-dehydratase